jgi:hypothetical protein
VTPLDRIAQILTEAGHSPADVKHYVGRLQEIMALRTLPRLLGRKLTDHERQHAYVLLRDGRSVEEVLAKLQQG